MACPIDAPLVHQHAAEFASKPNRIPLWGGPLAAEAPAADEYPDEARDRAAAAAMKGDARASVSAADLEPSEGVSLALGERGLEKLRESRRNSLFLATKIMQAHTLTRDDICVQAHRTQCIMHSLPTHVTTHVKAHTSPTATAL